jgi:hypothetical protein
MLEHTVNVFRHADPLFVRFGHEAEPGYVHGIFAWVAIEHAALDLKRLTAISANMKLKRLIGRNLFLGSKLNATKSDISHDNSHWLFCIRDV